MIALIICIVITLVAIGLMIYSIVVKDGGWGFVAFLILFLNISMGFGLTCSVITETSIEEKVDKFSYAKTESVLLIQTPTKNQEFFDAYTFNKINDSSEVILHINYNVYGQETNSYLRVK